jgi:hypothetical protein
MPGGSKDAGKCIGPFGASPNQERTWLKLSTASAPTTPATKQIANRWLSVVAFEYFCVVLTSNPCVAVPPLSVLECNLSAGWLPIAAAVSVHG